MPTAPITHALDQTAQDILTYASWGLTLALVGVAIRYGRQERTPFYLYLVLASMVAAFAEPLYDAAMDLYFYSNGDMYTHFTAFGIPQPIWTHSGYAVLYAAPAIFITRKIRAGTLTRNGLFAWAGVELLMSCAFEMVGINGGTFTYWGPHELRIFNYPLVIGVLEASQVMLFAVAASQLRERVKTRAGLLGVFPLFPITFFGANFGAGALMIISLHLDDTKGWVVALASVLSIACAAWLISAASSFLPATAARREATAPSSLEPRVA